MKEVTQFFIAAVAATVATMAAAADYSTGVFLLNEGQFGSPASICHLDADGQWTDRAFAVENEGKTLGNTGSFAQVYGDNIYIVSKQSNATGSILTKADAATLRFIAGTNALGTGNVEGRGFVATDDEKGYVGTSDGVAVVKLDDLSLLGTIEGIGGETGNMARVDDRVFIATKSSAIFVVDPETDRVVNTIDLPRVVGVETAIAGSITVACDGTIWASVAADGNGGTLPYLVKIAPKSDNAAELETQVVNIPDGIYAPANSWFSWTPDAFCASPTASVLYWNGGASSWACNQTLFKYDIEKGEFAKFYDFPSDQFLYGASMRVNPADGNIYFGYNTGDNAWTNASTLAVMSANGDVSARYPMSENYWYPSIPVFPDVLAPVGAVFDTPFEIDADQTATTIDLKGIATDADSHNALMVKTLADNLNPDLAEMEVLHGQLTVRPAVGANGAAVANIKVNSNGKEIVVAVPLDITSNAGVENVSANEASVAAYREQPGIIRLLGQGTAELYSLSGALLTSVYVDGNASIEAPAAPVIVRFAEKTIKL